MDVDERIQDVYESEQELEEFYRGLVEPFLETGVWGFPGSLEDSLRVTADTRRLGFSQDDVKSDDLVEELDEYGPIGGVYQIDGNAEVDWNEEAGNLIEGRFRYSPEDIITDQQAEEGSLLYELRKAYEEIAHENSTEYLEPNTELNSAQAEYGGETIFSIHVPPDYNPELYRETVEGLTQTAIEIENIHRDMKETVKQHQKSK